MVTLTEWTHRRSRHGPAAQVQTRSHRLDEPFSAIYTVCVLLSSPPPMFLFTTPLGCDVCIYHLPTQRAEAYRSIRAPVIHVGAMVSSRSQPFPLHARPRSETPGALEFTIGLRRFTSSLSASSSPGLRIQIASRTPEPFGTHPRALVARLRL